MECYCNIKKINKDIYHLEYKTKYELITSLLRIQEYYENPDGNIRGQVFTLEQLMDSYAEQHGNWTYFEDWTGFNFTGKSLMGFYGQFHHCLSHSEQFLFYFNLFQKKEIGKYFNDKLSGRELYFIGTFTENNRCKVSDLKHEIAHGLYSTNRNYRVEMLDIMFDEKKWYRQITDALLKHGYHRDFISDEIQAYCAAESKSYMLEEFDLPVNWKPPHKFKTVFNKYYNKIKK